MRDSKEEIVEHKMRINKMTRKQGDCGGTPKKDGSGQGTGNRGTSNQPPKIKPQVNWAQQVMEEYKK